MNPENLKTSLKHRGSPLALATEQLQVLKAPKGQLTFHQQLEAEGISCLHSNSVEILQVNLGKLCNMTCAHCHVDAGPDRREIMTRETVDSCIRVLEKHDSISTLDLTGGAPEMNPCFRDLVKAARDLDREVIDRCNLTILLAKGFTDLPEFLARHQVEIVASLPCYLEENTDAQRGDGAFQQSIEAIQRLNQLGYGDQKSDLILTLVYNPVGQSLPPDQATLEDAYRDHLFENYGIVFNRLFTITNMPVSRYLDHLILIGEFESYMEKLIEAFNPASIKGLMCRNTLSVGWDGKLYDCDFNQMLDLSVNSDTPNHIRNFEMDRLSKREITLGQHCFGCTAGAGSGCQGAIT